jgi:selenocysteine-specific translation elongation factor
LGTKEFRETVSSLESSNAQIQLSSKITPDASKKKSIKLKFVDVPGHEHFLEQVLDHAEQAS